MKRKLLNQIFVCLAIIGILVPCFIVPVAADAVDQTYVDILPAPDYTLSINGVPSYTLPTASSHMTGANSAIWTWNASSYNMSYQGFCFTIKTNNQVPDVVRIRTYTSGPWHTATRFSTNGKFVQYRVNLESSISNFSIEAQWDTAYTGTFSIYDCFGIVSDVYSVGTVAYREVRHTLISGIDSYGIITQHNSQELPLTRTRQDGDTYDFYDVIDIGVSESRLNYVDLDCSTILVGMPFADAEFTCYIGDDLKVSDWSTAAVYKVLPVEQAVTHSAKLDSGTGRYHTMYYYSVTVDLNGVDLSGKMLHFTFDVSPVDDDYLRWSVYYLCVKPVITSPPWYQSFFNWIKGFWNNKQNDMQSFLSSEQEALKDSITDDKNDLKTSITNDKNNLKQSITNDKNDLKQSITNDKNDLKQSITNDKNDLKTSIGQILTNGFNSLMNGSTAQNNQVTGDVGKMESNSDQLGQLNEDMKVDKPDITGTDVSASSIIPQVGMNLIATPILAFWQSPTILSVLVLVVTLILVSFVFFGKKG